MTTSYTQLTESMQTDPEARHCRDAASELSAGQFPIAEARCAGDPSELEWVPDRERSVVPLPMASLCRRCPGRQACLSWALTGTEQGYWGGTTTKDRVQLRLLERSDIETADWLQELARGEAEPQHEPGEGSYEAYRKGCRCEECRAENSAARAKERSRARVRAA